MNEVSNYCTGDICVDPGAPVFLSSSCSPTCWDCFEARRQAAGPVGTGARVNVFAPIQGGSLIARGVQGRCGSGYAPCKSAKKS